MAAVFGLIGYPLSHSWSATYFTEKFNREGIQGATYVPFPLKDLSLLPDLIRQTPGLRGLNVTIPHKEKVLNFLDELSGTARAIGAVNTITVSHLQGKILLKGDNTDAFGFGKSLEEAGVLHTEGPTKHRGQSGDEGPTTHQGHTGDEGATTHWAHTTVNNPAQNGAQSPVPAKRGAMILGTGGAARAVRHVLESRGWTVQLVSRSSGNDIAYDALRSEHFQASQLIVNATPLGMFPKVEGCPPIPYEHLTADHILYDLVYNPEQTRFLEFGKKAGCKTIGGHRMLVLQAEKSWEIWNRQHPSH
jgi:shikimate dehydrogenase